MYLAELWRYPIKSMAASAWGNPLGTMSEDEFLRICLSPGKAGEIVVIGNHVLKGYLNGAGDEETKFRVGDVVWHRTGDCGYFDDRGRIWLLGRASAIITDERGILYPFAVECAARKVKGIHRAALLGRNGERILLIQLSPNANVDHEALRKMLSWAHLDLIRFVLAIPMARRHNAKVDYGRLVEM